MFKASFVNLNYLYHISFRTSRKFCGHIRNAFGLTYTLQNFLPCLYFLILSTRYHPRSSGIFPVLTSFPNNRVQLQAHLHSYWFHNASSAFHKQDLCRLMHDLLAFTALKLLCLCPFSPHCSPISYWK